MNEQQAPALQQLARKRLKQNALPPQTLQDLVVEAQVRKEAAQLEAAVHLAAGYVAHLHGAREVTISMAELSEFQRNYAVTAAFDADGSIQLFVDEKTGSNKA